MDRLNWLRQMDWCLIAAASALVAIGVLAISAATEPAAATNPADRQLVWAAISLVAMFLAAWPNLKFIERLGYVSFASCIPLLIAVYWSEPINGAQRWLRFGPVGIQPSELAKLAYVIAAARFLARRQDCNRAWAIVAPIVMAAVPLILILRQPDLGTALLFPPILAAMLFSAGLQRRNLFALAIIAIIAMPFLWKVMSPVQRSRITGFLTQRDTGPRPRDDGYQLYQSKLVIALGGVRGSEGATDHHLPFDHTDFIFSVIAGQWGLAGVSLTLSLFALLLWRGLAIACGHGDAFGRLLAVGIVTSMATQGLINLAMTVGLAPVTGLTLPFISYGGSSLLTCSLSVGMLSNVGRTEVSDEHSV